MWFKFPQGTTALSCQQQNFAVEILDENGTGYFRAPDHFAALILGLPGFSIGAPPSELNPPADLPQADPLRDGAISRLSAENESLRNELKALREDLAVMDAAMRTTAHERNILFDESEKLKIRVAELESDEDDDDAPLDEIKLPKAKVKG